MENSLVIQTEASYTLNYLIYIQNSYLNQNLSEGEYKFPYSSTKAYFKEEFELKYKELWDELSKRIAATHRNDMKFFHEEKDFFYERLFEDSADSFMCYSELYHSFKVWWDSFAGRLSVERSIDDRIENVYVELANSLTQKGIKPQRELHISLVYDECLVGNVEVSSYFAVLSIKDFYVKYLELVPLLEDCIT